MSTPLSLIGLIVSIIGLVLYGGMWLSGKASTWSKVTALIWTFNVLSYSYWFITGSTIFSLIH